MKHPSLFDSPDMIERELRTRGQATIMDLRRTLGYVRVRPILDQLRRAGRARVRASRGNHLVWMYCPPPRIWSEAA